MASKRLTFKSAAREKVLKGAAALSDAVRVTLGPKSKSVLIEKKWGRPIVCNDGVTIAKEIQLEDPEENLGAQMMREAAERTGDAVGDGTSTSTILAHAIFAEGLHNVAAGASAIELKRGLDRGLRAAVESLHKLSRPVASRKEKAQIATVSAHNEPEIGEMVADAMEKVGQDGAPGEDGDILQHLFAPVAESQRLDRGGKKHAAHFVDHQCRQGLSLHIFRDDQQGLPGLGYQFEEGQKVLQAGDSLLMDQDQRIVQDHVHLLDIGNEVG